MTRPAALPGPDFDRAGPRHETASHKAAIQALRAAPTPAATRPALRDHPTDVLPDTRATRPGAGDAPAGRRRWRGATA